MTEDFFSGSDVEQVQKEHWFTDKNVSLSGMCADGCMHFSSMIKKMRKKKHAVTAIKNAIFGKLMVRIALIGFFHLVQGIIDVVYISTKPNLGLAMTLDTYVSQVAPVATLNANISTFAQNLNSVDVVKGGFPVTVTTPLIHFLTFAVYGLYWGFGEDLRKQYSVRSNPWKYYLAIVTTSLGAITLWNLLGGREILSYLLLIGTISGIFYQMIIVDGLIVSTENGLCTAECFNATTDAGVIEMKEPSRVAKETESDTEGDEDEQGKKKKKSKKSKNTENDSLVVAYSSNCRRHNDCCNENKVIKDKALNGIILGSLLVSLIFFVQLGLTWHVLPLWLNALTLTVVLLFVFIVFLYVCVARKTKFSQLEKSVYFYSNEHKFLWGHFLVTTVFTSVLLSQIATYPN